MVGPILLGIALLLFACLIAINGGLRIDGFDDAPANVCTSIKVDKACDNTADCNWDKEKGKCFSCADLTECGSCVNNNKCGWCGDLKKCVMSDRMGLPIGKACSESNYSVRLDQCTASTQPKFNAADPNFKTDQLNTDLPVMTASGASNCANEDKVVDIVKGRLANDIKALVRAELTANKITPVEGFQNLERGIAASVVASISDDVRAMVKKSLPKKV
jgi:hypothetical protein